jgi:hypothetical protein
MALTLQHGQAAHANHEKFVGVGRGDGQKLQPFQRRNGSVARLFQHAEVEFNPAQFPIQEERFSGLFFCG